MSIEKPHLLRVGDLLTISIDSRMRRYAADKNDPPDETLCTFHGFEHKTRYRGRTSGDSQAPGTYQERGNIRVILSNGMGYCTYASNLTPVDAEEHARRIAADDPHNAIIAEQAIKISDLPETKFWEGDTVIYYDRKAPDTQVDRRYTVESIAYELHAQAPFSFHEASCYNLVSTSDPENKVCASEAALYLGERGNVWKYYNGEQTLFTSLEEEMAFHRAIGNYSYVIHPLEGSHLWELSDAIKAVENGAADIIIEPSRGFGPFAAVFDDLKSTVIRFNDRNTGERARTETLKKYANKAAA
ncbi:MAG: hypothetical protein OSB62_07020 [Alphaproteobacteria bacterium]|nr:hypothetical protein [Alphaproteobacteria bacterium]